MSSADTDIQKQHLFGRWRFNADTGDLLDGKTTTRLEPQVAKLLDYFLCHQDKLTSRDELIAAVWENRIVSDDAVNRCISILRQTLSPDDQNAYIETVVRRGYISHFPPPPTTKPHAVQPQRRRNHLVLALFAAVVAMVLYGVISKLSDLPPEVQDTQNEGLPMVAVLPFTYSDRAADSEFFANGIHDDLLTQLSQLQSMRVISRTSVLEYRDTSQNIREIGRALGADVILEGGIQRIGDQIRINVQLIDAQTDGHLWADQYDRELLPASIFDVQTEITRAIASALQATLTEQDTTQLNVLPTENMAAYRAYHQALEIRDSKGTNDPAYMDALEQAVTLDPSFIRAWAEMVGKLSLDNFGTHQPELIARTEQILEKIWTIAPKSPEYLIAQAYYTYYILENYDLAHQLISQAQKMRPNDVRVVELKSWIERRLGDFDARIESIRLIQELDPRNPRWANILTVNLIITHRYDEASEVIRNATVQNFTLLVLNSSLQLREHQDHGRRLEALAALQKEFDTAPDLIDLWNSHIGRRDYVAAGKLVDGAQSGYPLGSGWITGKSTGVDVHKIITYWFLQASDQLDPLLIQARSNLDERRNPDGGSLLNEQYLALAFVSAAEGNTEETERLIRVWRRAASKDLASLTGMSHHACRALGMAAATTSAVKCIRTGLAEPSFVIPFIEPYLPYYDSIRDEQEFIDLLADIQGNDN